MSSRTALVSGFWGQNVGNAFFNIAGEHMLQSAGLNPFFVQDMPAYATFRNEEKGSFDNAFGTLEFLDFDLLVLQGPLFTRNFGNIWGETLKRLNAQGKRWAIMSGAFRKYTAEEQAVARAVFDAVPPVFVSTRDSVSYEMLESQHTGNFPLRSGIDSAFFLPQAYEPPTSSEKAIALCFDHFGEPELVSDSSGGIQIGDASYRLAWDDRGDRMASKSKAHAIAYQSLVGRKARPSEINGHRIIRPDHRTNPHMPFKIYRDPNGLASDEPWTYLAVYRNVALTMSDRVHACVATIAYGGTAMLHNPITKRSAMFRDVGASEIEEKPVSLDEELRLAQYAATVEFLREFGSVE